MIYTTLNKIRAHAPCADGWAKLLRHLGKTQPDDEPVSLLTILDSNGLDDALWCLRAVNGHKKEMRLYAVWCARQVQHLMTDPCALAALDVAERHAIEQATDSELAAARTAARAVARAVAWGSPGAVARAVAQDAAQDAAEDAARTAAWDAAWAAADSAARTAAWAAAWAAARTAAWDAARDAARASQTAKFRRVFCEEVTA